MTLPPSPISFPARIDQRYSASVPTKVAKKAVCGEGIGLVAAGGGA
jgi:hypothetical protein